MITSENILAPAGPIPGDMFPGDPDLAGTVDEKIELAYLLEPIAALGEAEADIAVRAYVIYQLAEAKYFQLNNMPSSADVKDEASYAFHMKQIDNWAKIRDEHLALFESTITVVQPTRTRAFSGPVVNRFVR